MEVTKERIERGKYLANKVMVCVDCHSKRDWSKYSGPIVPGTEGMGGEVFYLMIGSSIRHWFKHLRYGTQDYTDVYEIGLRSSNLQYAAYAFGHNMYCRFYQGIPLAALKQESQHSLEFSRTRVNQWAIDLLEGGLTIIIISRSPAYTKLSKHFPFWCSVNMIAH